MASRISAFLPSWTYLSRFRGTLDELEIGDLPRAFLCFFERNRHRSAAVRASAVIRRSARRDGGTPDFVSDVFLVTDDEDRRLWAKVLDLNQSVQVV